MINVTVSVDFLCLFLTQYSMSAFTKYLLMVVRTLRICFVWFKPACEVTKISINENKD